MLSLGPTTLLFSPLQTPFPLSPHGGTPPTGDFISWAVPGSADPLLLVRREPGPTGSARPVLELLGKDMGVAAVWMMSGGSRLVRSSGCSPRDTTAGGQESSPESTHSWLRVGNCTPGPILTGQVLLSITITLQAGGEEIRFRLRLVGISLE